MKRYLFTGIVSILIVGLSHIDFIQAYAYPATRYTEASDSGPEMVQQALIMSGAFETPAYSYTDEFDTFKTYPHLKGLFFDALPFHDQPAKVFCWYGVPEGASPGQKFPAVVLVHGGGGTVFPEWVKKWNDKGFVAISVALEGQVPGVKDPDAPLPQWPTHENSGPCRIGFFNDIETETLQNQWFYHAVADVILAHNLVRSFPEVDTSKIGITGISWGGILTNVITGLDDRFAFSVPVYGCGFLHETPNYSKLIGRLSPEAQSFYMNNWEPSLYIPRQGQPTLFVNGTNDCHFTMNSFTKSYRASPAEKYLRIEHNMVHGHAPGWEPASIYSFADSIISMGGKPFTATAEEQHQNGDIKFSYVVDIVDAYIYYTIDTVDWDCNNYEWRKLKASVDQAEKKIEGTLPAGTQYYFVNGTDDNGLLYSSPMQKVGIPIDNADSAVITRDPLSAADSFFFEFIPDVQIQELPAVTGSTDFTTTYEPSGSTWHDQCIEEDVFMARLKRTENDSLMWDLRIGRGGQIYSFIGPYEEGIPPQYRSWDFNTARWVDDVWQSVNVSTELNNADVFAALPGTTLGRQEMVSMKYFIHSAGVYLNDPIFLDQNRKPFYSPQMASFYDQAERSFATMHWGQQAHIPSIHKAEILNTTRYKDLGSGVIEATYISSNVGTALVNRHNMPWGGVRASSLPQCWLSKPDHTLERRYETFGGEDIGILGSIDESGGYFIWAAEGEDENRPALALVFGKDHHLDAFRTEYNMRPTQLRWGDGTNNADRDYSVFTVISGIDVRPGSSFFYRLYYISGTMKEVHERAVILTESADYGFIEIDPEQAPLTKIKSIDFEDGFTEDIKLFAAPVENMIPLFLIENSETGKLHISPDLYYDVNTEPFINPYDPGDPEYETYRDRVVYKPYDGKIMYKRLLGYGVKKEEMSTNIRFALLDTLIRDTSKVILTEEFKSKIWVPLNPCFNCAWEDQPEEIEGMILYNDFGDNQYVPWSDPVNLTFTDNEENPDPASGNSSLKVGKAVRGTGVHANVRFQLADYLDLSENNQFKVQVYYQGAEPVPAGTNVRLILRNNGLGTTQYALTREITSANTWHEFQFDCSGAVGKDTYNQAWLFFTSPDSEGTAEGQVFYIDNLMGPQLTMDTDLMEVYTNETGDSVIIDFSNFKDLVTHIADPEMQLVRANDMTEVVIGETDFDSLHIVLRLDEVVSGQDTLKLSYLSGVVSDSIGRILPYFKDKEVVNNVPVVIPLLSVGFHISDELGPVSGAAVLMEGMTKLSDEDGIVVFEELNPAIELIYEVTKEGYQDVSGVFSLTVDTTINIVLTRVNQLTGYYNDQISLFPNPARDELYLHSAAEFEKAEVINAYGQVLKTLKVSEEALVIRTDLYKEGVYILRLISDKEKVIIRKFIISR